MGWQVYTQALRKGLLLRPIGNVLYFNPPLTISYEEMDTAIALMSAALDDVFGI